MVLWYNLIIRELTYLYSTITTFLVIYLINMYLIKLIIYIIGLLCPTPTINGQIEYNKPINIIL